MEQQQDALTALRDAIARAERAMADDTSEPQFCVVSNRTVSDIIHAVDALTLAGTADTTVEDSQEAAETGFWADIAGEYGDDDGSIHLMDGDREIVMWDSAEWRDDPSVVFVIANAMRLGYTNGAAAVQGYPTALAGPGADAERALALVRDIARMTADGEPVDGEPFEMENDDAVATVNQLIGAARELLAVRRNG